MTDKVPAKKPTVKKFEKEGKPTDAKTQPPLNPQYDVEHIKDDRYRNQPIQKTNTVRKVFINDQIVDAVEDERYPRGAQSENFRVDVISPAAGIPMVHIKQLGWVGPAPLQVIESRLDELIELLSRLR